MRRSLICILFCFLPCGQALGLLMSPNQRLDRSLYQKHDPKLVVAVRILEIIKKQKRGDWPDTSIKVQVDRIILGPDSIENNFEIPISSFSWPEDLVPLIKDSTCILVLRENKGHKDNPYTISTVIAARTREFPHIKDSESAKRVLAAELLAVLKEEPSDVRRHAMILQVSPILTAVEARELLPFLKSSDPWTRRAALAGVLYATGEDKYLRMAEQDIREFLRTTKSSDLVDGHYSAYPMLFSHYFFLDGGWSSEEDQRNTAVLPLYRLIATKMVDSEFMRWRHGIDPLCRLGTREDVPTLYAYLHAERTGEKKEILGNPHYRQQIVMGISRIMGLNLPRVTTFPSVEEEQLRTVQNALFDQGIIKSPSTSQPSEGR